MNWEWFIVTFVRISFIITSPVTFIVGLFLLYDLNTYQKIEKVLAKSYGSTRKFVVKLERDRETFQMFLLKKRRAVGIICLLNSVFAVFTVLFSLNKY